MGKITLIVPKKPTVFKTFIGSPPMIGNWHIFADLCVPIIKRKGYVNLRVISCETGNTEMSKIAQDMYSVNDFVNSWTMTPRGIYFMVYNEREQYIIIPS